MGDRWRLALIRLGIGRTESVAFLPTGLRYGAGAIHAYTVRRRRLPSNLEVCCCDREIPTPQSLLLLTLIELIFIDSVRSMVLAHLLAHPRMTHAVDIRAHLYTAHRARRQLS